MPVSNPVAGQQQRADVGANSGMEQKVPRPRPGARGQACPPPGLALAASSASEVGPPLGSSRPERSTRLAFVGKATRHQDL